MEKTRNRTKKHAHETHPLKSALKGVLLPLDVRASPRTRTPSSSDKKNTHKSESVTNMGEK